MMCAAHFHDSHLNFSSAKHNAINYQKGGEKHKAHLVYKMKTVSITKHVVPSIRSYTFCWIIF